jgi:hypothetical protein
MNPRRRMVVLGGLVLYFLMLGFAAGMASERIRFDRSGRPCSVGTTTPCGSGTRS